MKTISRAGTSLAVMCLLAAALTLFSPTSSAAASSGDYEILLPNDNDYYQVQYKKNSETVCEGTAKDPGVRPCLVAAGDYIVINHTTNDRSEKTVTDSGATGSNSDSSTKPHTPKFKTVGQIENYIEVSWHPISNATGVNIYRNSEWIDSVNFPHHIMNDFKGKPGDVYHLQAYKDEVFSEKSEFAAAATKLTNSKSQINDDGTLTLTWTALPGYRYKIYRQTSGPIVQLGLARFVGLATNGESSYRDTNPVVGGMYAIQPIDPSGRDTPLIHVAVDYNAGIEDHTNKQLDQAGLPRQAIPIPIPPLPILPGTANPNPNGSGNLPEPPDPKDPSNTPGIDPTTEMREQSLRDLFSWIDGKIEETVDDLTRFTDAANTPSSLAPTLDQLEGRADDDRLNNGFLNQVPGQENTWAGPNGSTFTQQTHGNRVVTIETRPDPRNPQEPGSVKVVERTMNADGTYTRTQTIVNYSYAPDGQWQSTGVSVSKTAAQKRIVPGRPDNDSDSDRRSSSITVNPETGVTENISGSVSNSLTESKLDSDRCDSCP